MGLKHAFASGKSDGGDATQVQPSNWNDDHALTEYLDYPIPTSDPAAPSANTLRVYSKNRSGRMFQMMVGPAGLDTALQPALFGNNIAMWLPGVSTTASISFGVSWTVTATQSHPTPTSTNFLSQMKRAQYATSATIGNASGVKSASPICWRGNASGVGGFFFFARFGVTTFVSTMQIHVGLGPNTLLAGEPSAQNNSCGICKDSGDTNWQFYTRSGSTTTKVDLGVAVAANQCYDFMMFATPNGSGITYRVVDTAAGTVVADNVSATTNLPVNTTFLYGGATCRTTAAAAVAIALNRIYVESDT